MSAALENPQREAILRRINYSVGDRLPESGPLTWDDYGLLAQGLAMAARPLHLATRTVTERYSLGPRGAWLLNLINAGIVFPHELAEVFGIGRSLISSELSRLAEAGLIESRPGATDRRRTELALTELGNREMLAIRAGIEKNLAEALADYSAEEIRLCARMLGTLREKVSI
ncbi:MarR family winged helix-turn-helix transcriptional regulator [Novosphingobium sp. TH158]|uniref:MarR family winged helix-turn-helix transcriptional regulator n=1 Tax=Novosphingobium sp. TH158 TaxID=2067455 RepID=UPI000C7A5E09|nr:MarR family transcriptional regulator [Novosphingobium sp. TH158]PLK26207.1 hypothetical protein C0V78_04400 [Novosphingobium sp. TH158]